MRTSSFFTITTFAGAITLLAACSGENSSANAASSETAATSASASAAATGPQTPDPNGKVIEVDLVTDENGSYFEPNDFEARQGDVVRFTLQQGVHNVHFLPDSNLGKQNLPAPSDMLQLPGQTYDLKVALGAGRYFFQCDPHAALGMVGYMTVTE